MEHNKYEYKRLYKDHYDGRGNYYWFFEGEKLDDKYRSAYLFDVLNELGEKGWQLILKEDKAFIMMRENKE